MKILIVDDELVSRMTLQKLMSSLEGCEVEAVENGEDALAHVESENLPDLILLDILMPGVDGFHVCEKVKGSSRTKDIPVIFLSGNSEVEDKTRGLELGAVDYITKPFHKAEVKARVLTHLSLKKMREDLLLKNVTLENQMQEIQEKTEQLREKEIQLLEMDRVAGIGTLAAGIAHEINNPLGFLKSTMGNVKKSMDKLMTTVSYWEEKSLPEPLMKEYKEHLQEINFDHITSSHEGKFDRITKGIERIMKIVNSLRSFSRVDKEESGKVNINQSIEEVIDILTSQEDTGVEFKKELQEIPLIECYAGEINQTLLHVVKNALDAVQSSGTITIKTKKDEERDGILIHIADNGVGMTPEVLRQAFNPFFTTKSVGSGTGVGLSLTERIIKRHKGEITLSSEEGVGTTASIFLTVSRKMTL